MSLGSCSRHCDVRSARQPGRAFDRVVERRQRADARLRLPKASIRSRSAPATTAPASKSPASTAQLDQFMQTQLRTETSGGAYADQMASVLTPVAIGLRNARLAPGRSKPPIRISRPRCSRCRPPPGSSSAQIAAADGGADRWRSSSTPRRRASRRCAPMPSRISTFRSGRPTPRCSRSRRSTPSCRA